MAADDNARADSDQIEPGRTRSPAPPEAQLDPASEHLANALRISFRLLSVIMVLMVIAFAVTGTIETIQTTELGLNVVFGRIVGKPMEPGLHYTWPFPVGQIIGVMTREQEMVVHDFWMHETAADKTKALKDRKPPKAGLRPEWDGALLTGDRYLIHARLKVRFKVSDPVEVMANVESVEDVLRSVLCNAAIKAAGSYTADGIMRMKREKGKADDSSGQVTESGSAFTHAIERLAQEQLNELNAGIEIKRVTLGDNLTWPLAALAAYEQAQQAPSEKEKTLSDARKEAASLLNAAAGKNYATLVGEPTKSDRGRADNDAKVRQLTAEHAAAVRAGRTAAAAGLIEQLNILAAHDLIGKHERALSAGEKDTAAGLLKQINALLESNKIGGQAIQIIQRARTDRKAITQRAETWVDRYTELVPHYERLGKTLLEVELATVLGNMLASDTVETVVLHSGNRKIVLKTREDQGIVDEIQRVLAKRKKELEDKARKAGK